MAQVGRHQHVFLNTSLPSLQQQHKHAAQTAQTQTNTSNKEKITRREERLGDAQCTLPLGCPLNTHYLWRPHNTVHITVTELLTASRPRRQLQYPITLKAIIGMVINVTIVVIISSNRELFGTLNGHASHLPARSGFLMAWFLRAGMTRWLNRLTFLVCKQRQLLVACSPG